jgi:two-component system response regulator HydG
VDVRIIAATNKQLEEEVSKGRFREDLYYRINVVPITIPPLRERREDIPLLAEHFLRIYSEKNKRAIRGFDEGVMQAFMQHSWPGNVREIENIVERMVIMSKGDTIALDGLPPALAGQQQEGKRTPSPTSLKDMERDTIVKTLEKTGGNRTKTAAILGITRKTLQNKIKEYGIDI